MRPLLHDGTRYEDRVRWLAFINEGASEIPPGALLRVIGLDDDGRYRVQEPSADGQKDLMIAGPSYVSVGDSGSASYEVPFFAAYEAFDGARQPSVKRGDRSPANGGFAWGGPASSFSGKRTARALWTWSGRRRLRSSPVVRALAQAPVAVLARAAVLRVVEAAGASAPGRTYPMWVARPVVSERE